MARPRKHDGILYQRPESKFWWMRYRDLSGARHEESTGTFDWKEANQKLRERLQSRDDHVLEVVKRGERLTLKEWAAIFLEHHSKPPFRSAKTHEANVRVLLHMVEAFGRQKLSELTADMIEAYLRNRLKQRVRWKTSKGYVEGGLLKPSTVHQELRVLRRALNVAVRKKLLVANPCFGVEFPVMVRGMFRPHYVSVGAAAHRGGGSGVLAKRDSHHHGNRTTRLQGTDAHEAGADRPRESSGLDS
jgi:hypothetical protein